MEATDTFERSIEQRRTALLKANEVRFARAKLKRELKERRRNPLRVLQDPPDYAMNMKVEHFLMAVPRLGRSKVVVLLQRCQVSPTKTLGGLSDRQRCVLARGIKERIWTK